MYMHVIDEAGVWIASCLGSMETRFAEGRVRECAHSHAQPEDAGDEVGSAARLPLYDPQPFLTTPGI